jgi:hypothetical protein
MAVANWPLVGSVWIMMRGVSCLRLVCSLASAQISGYTVARPPIYANGRRLPNSLYMHIWQQVGYIMFAAAGSHFTILKMGLLSAV